MKRSLYISLLSLALVSGLGLLAAPTPTHAFDLSKGIVGNISNKECSENGNCTFCDFIQLFIILERVILGLFAGLALVMLIWGGQGIITSAGNQEKYTSSRKLITSTLLGILIVLAAYFLINIIVGILTTSPGPNKPLNTTLFGKDWWEAQCLSSKTTERSFCANQLEGTPCGTIQPNKTPKQVCSGGQCIDTCTTKTLSAPTGATFRCMARGVTLGTNASPTNNYCENSSEQCWAICPPTPPAGPCGTPWKCSEEGYWVCS